MISFHWEGLLISLALLLPNLLFLVFPPHSVPEEGQLTQRHQLLQGLERLGQIGYTLLPTLLGISFEGTVGHIAFIGMILSLLFYYIGWLRYFLKGRHFHLLFSPMLRIPLPMALGPIVYFVFASLGAHSWFMGGISLLFAAGHIPMSYRAYQLSQ